MDEVFTGTQRRGVEEDVTTAQPPDCSSGGGRTPKVGYCRMGRRDQPGWRARDKFAAVVETAGLSEAEQAEYCRKRGLYPDQLHARRTVCEQATEGDETRSRTVREQTHADKQRIKDLEHKLARKEKALAETAALLTLRPPPRRSGGGSEAVEFYKKPRGKLKGMTSSKKS